MKNTIKILGIASIAVISLNSCRDYLSTEPIVETTFPYEEFKIKNGAEAELLMNSIYSEFGGEYWQLDYFVIGDSQTDNSYAGADNPENFQQDEYRIYTTNGNVNRDWNYLTGMVNKCNKIIYYVNEVSDLSPSRKDEMIGEAYALRALANFQAVQLWGDFPLITKVITNVTPENLDELYPFIYPSRNSVEEVYASIIEDLTQSIAKAPTSNAANKGKATRNAAKGLLAKVYATKPSPDWAKTEQLSSEVINGGYSLLPAYEHLFDNQHELNAESIWEVDGQGWGSTIGAWGTGMFLGTDWKKFMTPSNDLVQSFDNENDTERKATSVKFTNVTWPDTYWGSNFPFANKMRDTNGNQNFYLLRLADLVLLKAEAKVNLGDLSGAADLINLVRGRVNLSPVSIVSKEDGINKILHERKLELSFEGQRWFDLKRTGKAVEILSKQKDGNGAILPYAANINQNRLLWPIPQNQRDKNINLTQNPGY
ncbi:RagB/SusD family nutrient uptake outer membrane protein [Kaistella sp. DKR-2]|uniref:RagB/SusD family nutrient uptake outer membrane protein n=1 Tax=Kaistella soli TaxID=2849654 RepID=UPI001C2619E8|nr:RagB/SusD family nutrient uptake outer membrane protein [Kaistella soli]MBU8882096.1 RagB/SusD family nutrient uptake outer membrane protein [Kaistella soli]